MKTRPPREPQTEIQTDLLKTQYNFTRTSSLNSSRTMLYGKPLTETQQRCEIAWNPLQVSKAQLSN